MSDKRRPVLTGETEEGVPIRRFTDPEPPPMEEEEEEPPVRKPAAKQPEPEPEPEPKSDPEPVRKELKDKNDLSEPDNKELLLAILEVESSNGKNLMREEPQYKWLHKPKEWAKKFGLSEEIEIDQQKKSYGPLQIMGATARELGFEGDDLYELRGREGIRYGIRYFRKQKKRYSNWMDAVAAYNAGSAKKKKDGTYENQQYVDKVVRALKNVRARQRR